MAKSSVHVTKTRTVKTTTARVKNGSTGKGNPNRCPVCGKFIGKQRMDKETAKTRKRLRQIGSVYDFENILEQSMLSEEEKTILRMHYKEQKPLCYIADELGMSEITVKKKHRKMLMKIGKLF